MAEAGAGSNTRFDIERLVTLGRVGEAVPSPCGQWLAVAVERLDEKGGKYVGDLWRISATDADAAPVRLTWGEHPDRRPRYRADGALFFLSTRPGPGDDEERTQVWMMPPGGGEPRPATDEPTGVSGFEVAGERIVLITAVWPGVAHDAQRAHHDDRRKRGPSALRYRTMPVRSWDHWLPSAAPHLVVHGPDGRVDLTPAADREHRDASWGVSADGRRAAIGVESPGADRLPQSRLQVFDLDAGTHRFIDLPPRTLLEGLALSADGRWAVGEVHTRQDGALGRPQLMAFDLDAGTGSMLAPDWDVHPKIGAVHGGRAIVWAGVRGRVQPYAVNLADGAVKALCAADTPGCVRGVRPVPGGGYVAIVSRMTRPPEVARFAGDGTAPKRLASLSGFDPAWVDGIGFDAFTVKSIDGSPVHSLVLRPAIDGPRPTLLWIHGGPVGQHEDGWHWRWNALVAAAAGYTVVLPNPRGSTGYGQGFIEGIWNNNWGGICFDDIMASVDHAVTDPGVDAERIAVMGASFGGYMTNWIGARTGDRFRCMVTHASVYRMSTFHGTSDWPAWFQLQAGVSPADPEFDRHSPHRLVHQWTAPALVTHGEKDYRVPIGQALLLFEDLQRHGVDSELMVFPDENHWLLKPRNITAWYAAWQDFVARHLA